MRMPSLQVGYAHFYENVVIYGQGTASFMRSKRRRSKAGQFIGSVKGLIPVDPYYVLYEYHKSTKAFKDRQKLRAWLKKRKVKRSDLNRYIRKSQGVIVGRGGQFRLTDFGVRRSRKGRRTKPGQRRLN